MNPSPAIDDDKFTAAVLLSAGERGVMFHEEVRAERNQKKIGNGAEPERHVRFTAILPDGRLISTAQYFSRREALAVTCRALEPYLGQFAVRQPALKK